MEFKIATMLLLAVMLLSRSGTGDAARRLAEDPPAPLPKPDVPPKPEPVAPLPPPEVLPKPELPPPEVLPFMGGSTIPIARAVAQASRRRACLWYRIFYSDFVQKSVF
jgi:hypothetical protein